MATTGQMGASVASVSGTGASRTVVVNTGAGSGAIGLHVKSNATITDLSGNAIGRGYAGGEVFTIQRSPSFVINDFFSAGHGDVQAAFSDDWLELKVTPDGFEYENDEVLIYGNSEALTVRPAVRYGTSWALMLDRIIIYGPTMEPYLLSQSKFLVVKLVPGGTVAAHTVSDPRVGNTGTYVRLELVSMRSSQAGAYSVFSNDLTVPRFGSRLATVFPRQIRFGFRKAVISTSM